MTLTAAFLIFVYHLASRLTYVLGVGVGLTQQWRHQRFTRRGGVEEGFRRFRRLASFLMNNDGLSFVALCVATHGTLQGSLGLRAGGVVLVLAGVGVKLWAARSLGAAAYYWHNFFAPPSSGPVAPAAPGPYRYLRNPMYTVGYLHTYGLALVLGSQLGLVASAFDQLAILAFYYLVEKPHFELLTPRRAPSTHGSPKR